MNWEYEQVSYDKIPAEPRRLLDGIYEPEGVEMWWNSRSTLLDQYSAAQMWQNAPEGQRKVMMIIEMLAGGAYA